MKKINFQFLVVAAFALVACTQEAPVEWSPAGDRIMTKWGEKLDPQNVHAEYPRPQLVRENWKNLNGLWDYAITAKDATMPEVADGKILVPFSVESALSGVGRTFTENDALWYRTTIKIPSNWKKQRVILNFEAVDWETEVFVNGKSAGTHTGAYTHFSFDITDLLKEGSAQEISIKVYDATNANLFQPRGKQVLNPRGIWYTAVSGIWQTVWAESVPQAYVSDYNVLAGIDGTLKVSVDVDGASADDMVEVSVIDGGIGFSTENVPASAKTLATASGKPGENLTISIPNVQLWSPDSPYLYGLRFKVIRNGKSIDEATGYTAFREIGVKIDANGHKRFALNGKQVFMFGPLDQGWWPDGLHTAPSDEALKFDVIKTKDFGFNMIRKHIKVEPSRWYYHCDQAGMLVWQDMPSFGAHEAGAKWEQWKYNEGVDFGATPEAKANYRKEWTEIIAQNKKFPCIVVWVPFNEAWSQFDTPEIIDYTRSLDPSRLINMASGGNWWTRADGTKLGDIMDSHNYPNPKMHLVDPDLISVVGEYGGIGLPLEGHLWQADKNWGYVKYKNGDEVLATYEQFAEELKAIEGCSGAVYTQTTDVEIEVNGIMTYDRKVIKVNEAKLKAINDSVVKAGSE